MKNNATTTGIVIGLMAAALMFSLAVAVITPQANAQRFPVCPPESPHGFEPGKPPPPAPPTPPCGPPP